MSLDIVVVDQPPDKAFQMLWAPLVRFNEEQTGTAKAETLAVLLSEPPSDKVVGGLWGRSLWGSMYIDVIFLPAHLRRNGIGSMIMRRAEAEAIRRGCHVIWLDTYAFQGVRPFYEQLGYIVFGTIEGPSPVYPHFFLRKDL
jgi:GNAT superfamily N-acetyltransferase